MKQVIDIRKLLFGLGIVCLLLGTSVVLAQEDEAPEPPDPAEATIRLMGVAEAELPEAVTKEISLPPAAIENRQAVENAERGRSDDRGSSNGRGNAENGLSRADEARERGAEMAEQAKENRENRGRFEDRPEPPGRPDNPGPPDRPPGPPQN